MKNQLLLQIQKLYEKYFLPLNESEKQKIIGYFYISVSLIAVSFFAFFAIGPTLNTISSLNKQYDDNLIVKEALQTKIKNLKNLDTQYIALQEIEPQIYDAIPKTTQIPKLTRQIENIADQTNVAITNLTFNKVEIYPYSEQIPMYSFLFTVNVEGVRADVDRFLATLINFNRIVGVERVSTGKSQEGKYTLSITSRAFFAPK